MQIDEDEFEMRLRELKPKEPSGFLKARIASKMEALDSEELAGPGVVEKRHGKVIWGTTFTALVSAMAAVWAVLLVLDNRSEPSRIAGEIEGGLALVGSNEGIATFEVDARPIEQYATLVGAEPSPVYYLEDGQPVQRVALRYRDTEVWEMEDGEGTYKVSSFRNEIRVIPVQSF